MQILRYSLLLLVVGAVLTEADAQAQQYYPYCFSSSLFIGEAPDKPFTANIVATSWETTPDGSRKVIDLPKREPAYFIARDGKGRVVIKSRHVVTTKGLEGSGESQVEEETLCDPVTGTESHFSYQDLFHRLVNPSTKQTIYSRAGAGGIEIVETQRDSRTTEGLRWFRKKVPGRDNLGSEMFEGISAERYRFPRTDRDGSGHELVLSTEFEAYLAEVRYVSYPTTEQETKLDHIRKREPDPSLFEVPQGVMFQRIQKKEPTGKIGDQKQIPLP